MFVDRREVWPSGASFVLLVAEPVPVSRPIPLPGALGGFLAARTPPKAPETLPNPGRARCWTGVQGGRSRQLTSGRLTEIQLIES